MRFIYLIGLVVLFSSFTALAQMPSGAPEEMQALSILEGEWAGEGWTILRDGKRHSFVQHEKICPALDGALLLIEGVGRAKEYSNRIVHHAFAVLSYHPFRKQYFMRSYLANGLHVDADITVDGQTVIWQFQPPQAGIIRYTINIKGNDSWVEIGEMSHDDGKTWRQFFAMKLDKQDSSPCL